MRRLQRYTVALGAIIAATISWTAGASAQEFIMKLAHHYPDAHIQAAGLRTFVSEVEMTSCGGIKI